MTAPNPTLASQQHQLCPGTAAQTESHPHSHPHGHGAIPSSRSSLVAMGMAGGLVPSPSALLVFLAALGLGHPWFGTGLVVAFGLGMAATLAAVGLVVMRLRERAESRLVLHPSSRLAPLLRLLPLLTAGAVTLLGVVLATRGLAGTELLPLR